MEIINVVLQDGKKLYKIADVALILNVSKRRIYKLIDLKKIKYVNLQTFEKHILRITRNDLIEYIKKMNDHLTDDQIDDMLQG